MNESTRTLQRMFEAQGHIVLTWSYGPLPVPRVGQVLSQPARGFDGREEVPGPFVVIGYATAEDYIEQGRPFGLEADPTELQSYVAAFLKVVAE